MKYFIGIDPGKKGAIAIINQDMKGKVLDYSGSIPLLAQEVRSFIGNVPIEETIALIEKVWYMGPMDKEKHTGEGGKKRDGGKGTFTFGSNFGAWQMLLCCLNLRYELVTPIKWQSQFLEKKEGDTTKKQSLSAAARLFPDVEIKRKDGRSDALLIALHCMKQFYRGKFDV